MRRALLTLVAAIVAWGGLAGGVPVQPASGDGGRPTAVDDGVHDDTTARAVAHKEARPTVSAFRSPLAAPLGAASVLALRVVRLRRAASGEARPWRCVPSVVRRRGPPVGAACTPSPAR